MSLGGPNGVATDSSGNMYIADTYNNRIREVLASAPFFAVSSPAGGLSLSATSGGRLQEDFAQSYWRHIHGDRRYATIRCSAAAFLEWGREQRRVLLTAQIKVWVT